MNNDEKLKRIMELNEKYRANHYDGMMKNGNNFEIIHGKLPILLSAPHAVRQNRCGQVKRAETLTGAIVEFLCERTGSNGIIRTCNLQDDPNSENVGYGLQYKKAILELAQQKDIAFMLDIHGCSDNHPFDIDIGTNNGKNLRGAYEALDSIHEKLSAIGHTVIDKEFGASQYTTICNYISKHSHISCFQIELSRTLRKNSNTLLPLLDSFEMMIAELSQQLEQKKK